jgi:hypothetical protein
MTSAERIEAALLGQSLDHLPFCPFLAYVWESFPREVQEAGIPAFHARVGADPLWRGAPCPVRAVPPDLQVESRQDGERIRTEIRTPVGSLYQASMPSVEGNTQFLVEHPLKSVEDYKVQLWIEEHTRYELDLGPVTEHMQGPGREGLSVGMLIPRSKSAYQLLVEHLAGTEELIYALMDFPEVVEELWARMVQADLEAVRLAVGSGAYGYYLTWEDSSTQNYSPSQYDRYIGSEIGQWCRILEDAGAHYIQHACGHLRDLVVRMREHGAFGVESLSPPPTGNLSLREARARVGQGFGIIGGIEPTSFLNLSHEELAAYTEQVIEDGSGGPFVLANSDSCPPGVTEAKFRLVAEIARHAQVQ